MRLNSILFTLLLLSLSTIVMGQADIKTEQFISDLLETTAQNNASAKPSTQAFEDLLDIANHPILINKVTEEELDKLIFLTPVQIKNIYAYKQRVGDIHSIYQLQGVTGLTLEDIKNLQHFLSFNKVKRTKLRHKHLDGQLLARDIFDVENAQAYKKNKIGTHYAGDKHHLYTRFQARYGSNWQGGFTIDKDQGESILYKHPDYFDFHSAYLSYSSKAWLKTLIIGDYNVNIGQGLVLWTGTNMGKGTDVLNIIKRGSSISKYTSANENSYFRGIATTLSMKGFELTLWGNFKRVDANIQHDADRSIVISMPSTSYHRTTSEILNRHTLKQRSLGFSLNYRYKKLTVEAGAFYNHYLADSISVKPIYKRLSSPKIKQTNYWLNYKYSYGKLICFGELASTDKFSVATLNGLIFSPQDNVNISLLYRQISIKYYSLFTNAFTEYGNPSGEEGLYLGILTQALKNTEISAYFDTFKNKWLKYHMYSPSQGYELMFNADYKFNKQFELYLRYKEEEKAKNTEVSNYPLYDVKTYNKKALRFHGSYKSSSLSRIQFRIEQAFYNIGEKHSKGYLSYIDFKQGFLKDKLSVWMRYIIFDTDDYDTRIYTYENDLLYSFYTPSFQDSGTRFYIQCRWKIIHALRIWLKYSRTRYDYKTKIGSGINAINGNTRTNLKFQLQYVF